MSEIAAGRLLNLQRGGLERRDYRCRTVSVKGLKPSCARDATPALTFHVCAQTVAAWYMPPRTDHHQGLCAKGTRPQPRPPFRYHRQCFTSDALAGFALIYPSTKSLIPRCGLQNSPAYNHRAAKCNPAGSMLAEVLCKKKKK